MNVPLIEEDVAVAREKFAEYRAAVKARHCAEDAMVLACYRQLCRGRKLVNIVEAMRAAGVKPTNGLPQLAIARASWRECYFDDDKWRNNERFAVFSEKWSPPYNATSSVVRVPASTFPPLAGKRWRNGKAIVPTIPPALRPSSHLSNYHILWEAEWERVPVDPVLLKHVGGPVYAVLAMWDLTPVEQAVLGLRSIKGNI